MAEEVVSKGDRVRLTHEGKTVDAVVLLASSNGRSLMLEFDALVGGYAGSMPLLQGEDGVYRDLLNGEVVEIAR